MRGGHGNRKFYRYEVDRIESFYQSQYPKSTGYTTQEIEAGFESLAKQFGFFHTLLFMEAQTPYNRDQLEKWTVAEFKNNLLYLAHHGKVMKRYQELINKK